MKKAIFIVGPTSSGKTALALNLAEKIPAIIISADSVQVFQGTDIISGKDLPADSQFEKGHYSIGSTSIYLVDIVKPSESFSVFEFLSEVKKIIKIASSQNQIPIIVGGTRFYIDALTSKIDTLSIPPDESLRKKLINLTVEELQDKLKDINPKRFKKMNRSDSNNPRRLIRAIEVLRFKKKGTGELIFNSEDILMIGLSASFEHLKKKIDLRLKMRIEEGALEEARVLFMNYENLSDQIKSANGYKQLFEYLSGIVTLEAAIESWLISEYQLAKEQLKWLANKTNTKVFDIEKPRWQEDVLTLINHSFQYSSEH